MITNRFAISARSKKNRSNALNEEILIDKQTGEILVKSPTGDIISYNYFNRLKAGLNNAINCANTLNVIGNIFSVNLTKVSLPSVITFNYELINTTHTVVRTGDKTFSKFIILLDLDVLIPVNGNIVIESDLNPNVIVKGSITSTDNSVHTFTINSTLKELSSTVQSAVYSNLNAISISITSINIDNNSLVDDNSIRNILSNIIIVTDLKGTTTKVGMTSLIDLSIGSPNIIQVIKKFVFGNKNLDFYNDTKNYNKGDLILVTENDEVVIKQALTGTSGVYDSTKWEGMDLSTTLMNIAPNLIMISLTEPLIDDNKLWVKPLKYKNISIPKGVIQNVTMVFNDDAFPIVDEIVPEIENNSLYFDDEGTYDAEEEAFESERSSLLNDQQDVAISDDEPLTDVELWIDTDLTK